MSTTPITVAADAVIEFLSAQGIQALHNYPGGTIAPLLDACPRFGIRVYTSRHEQGAGYAALAQARLTGLPGIAAATSGPGVTNIVTPIADAYYDSIPMLVLTGQVGTGDLNGDKPIRQSGFQEVDTPALMRPITKAQFQPKTVAELIAILPEAWRIAMDGRKGPVSVDLPMDVQRAAYDQKIAPLPLVQHETTETEQTAQTTFLTHLIKAIGTAQKPVIICGSGMASPEHAEMLAAVRRHWPAPVSHSLPGVGTLDGADPACLGFHGHTGSQIAGKAITEADLLLVLGSRLDVRQTGTLRDQFAAKAKIFRVDFDADELACSRISHHEALHADLGTVLPRLAAKLANAEIADTSSWMHTIQNWRQQLKWPYPDFAGAAPDVILETLSDLLPQKTLVTTGVGAHQHWVARHFRFALPDRRLLTSAGHGAMGFDLPTAIGAAIHAPDHTVLCVAGDGSFQMNLQELGTVAELGLNLKILVLDNQRLGLVSQFQLMNWETDTACGDKHSPDFAAIARGYGITAIHCDLADDPKPALQQLATAKGPALLHLQIDQRHDVLPMLMGGQAMDKMWPYFDMQGHPKEVCHE